ncbi:MAG: Mrp/NBP35 family ATP-binding protein [Rhodospirillaceae bacterium]|jgi:ATP-binding protein involved in chromosome partitioning|nr:Mrp/NBP35 family ATP-binding protein [Rhodospirillaceae bacterium]MBT5358512.1 Mrp/NBP35 family ATP-binding protein [Rhodospirillaceae bacterium]MBT5767774.1 Mrp/NBP35 family ATP-binding protein [Rhodospirillaceae bacterium]MBT6310771.1 Mrp/NBP35 family ATP-binding protein [Rhodospirillaceae bacterium]MBT7364584.1 Mrp/NBP35 family ATP-binding protein [Rhodospirillaceae bacterium]
MTTLSQDDVRTALCTIVDPVSGKDIIANGMVSGLVIKDRNIGFAIEIDPADAEHMEPLRKAAERAVLALDGVSSVSAVLTAHNAAPASQPEAAPGAPPKPTDQPAQAPATSLLPDVAAIVAVASGKGGVGKSTTAVNLAVALSSLGQRVGILDADVYGPSLPRMLGITDKPKPLANKRIAPLEAHGVKVMSMGFMVPEDTAMVWRGPMVIGALEQMMREVEWGALDVLIVDMPPGTGDAQLTMAQRVPLAGVVIVSTPQDIALIDARKGMNMFAKVNVPVLGIVENMSMFICPNCGEQTDIFGHGGARAEAERLGCDFLGEIPLDVAIRITSDSGQPITASEPDGPHAAAYRDLASAVLAKISTATMRPAPSISID